jgi:hypothetical protein
MDSSDLTDTLRHLLREVLDERARIPQEEHREHHEWVRGQIERGQARAEFWRALAAKSLPAMVWSLVAAGAGWLWHLIRSHVTWS